MTLDCQQQLPTLVFSQKYLPIFKVLRLFLVNRKWLYENADDCLRSPYSWILRHSLKQSWSPACLHLSYWALKMNEHLVWIFGVSQNASAMRNTTSILLMLLLFLAVMQVYRKCTLVEFTLHHSYPCHILVECLNVYTDLVNFPMKALHYVGRTVR